MASRDLSPSALRLTQEFATLPANPEPRSFAGVGVKVRPIPTSKPTNADLARGFNELHLCHEDTKRRVEDIRVGLGLDEAGKPVAGLSTPRQSFVRTFVAVIAAIGAVVAVYRFSVAIWPAVWALLKVANAAILAGKL